MRGWSTGLVSFVYTGRNGTKQHSSGYSVCEWTGVTNDSKMMFRHYLQASSQKGKACNPLDEVRAVTGSFVNEMQVLWKDFKHQQGGFTTDALPGLETIWSNVDKQPAWKFWDGVPTADDMVDARKAGIQLTARASATSCCEFNWSDLDDIIGKRRTQLNTETIEKLARNRAVHRLKKSVATIDCNKKLPTLELMIDLELQKAQHQQWTSRKLRTTSSDPIWMTVMMRG